MGNRGSPGDEVCVGNICTLQESLINDYLPNLCMFVWVITWYLGINEAQMDRYFYKGI